MKRILFVVCVVAAAVFLVSCVTETQNTETSQAAAVSAAEETIKVTPPEEPPSRYAIGRSEEQSGMLEPTTIQEPSAAQDEIPRETLVPYMEPTSRSVDEQPELLPLEEPSRTASDEK